MTFVGAGRIAAVDGLVAAFDGVQQHGATWVNFTAPSGWGKTSIAHEFYSRLAAAQAAPPYWPPVVVDVSTIPDVSARRKQVAPTVFHNPDSLPEFMWWGIACSVRNGTASVALAEDLGQFRAHLGYLMLATRNAAERRNFLKAVLGDLVSTMTELVVTSPVPTPAGMESEMGIAASVAKSILQSAVGFWAERRQAKSEAAALLSSDDEIRAEQETLIDTAVEAVVSVARGGLPVVVFVEDVHLADPALCEVLARVIAIDRPVLILTTAVPGHAAENEALQEAITIAATAGRFVDASWDTPLPAPFPPGANLDALALEDRMTMLRSEFTAADPAVAQLLCERYENPLALMLFCQLPRYRNAEGGLAIKASDIDRLPKSVRGLYESLWTELPGAVRTALALAAAGIPDRIDQELGRNHEWDWALTAEAARALGLPDAAAVADALRDTANAYAWARIVSEHLRRFHDPDQIIVAADDDSFFDEDEALSALARALESATGLDLTDEEILHRSRLALALHATGHLTDLDLMTEAALNLVGTLSEQPLELDQVIEVSRYALAALPDEPSEIANTLRESLATALVESGQVDAGIAELESLVDDCTVLYGPEDRATLVMRNGLGDALREGGHAAAAVALFESLAEAAVQSLGPDDPTALIVRNNLALSLEDAGDSARAIAMHRALLPDRVRVLGPDDPGVLRTRNNLALALTNAGAHDEAIEQFEVLVADRARILGSDAPGTLTTRNNLALALTNAGRLEEAVEEFRRVVDDRIRVLGPDHPRTMTSRSNLASTLARTGDLDAAIDLYRTIIAEEVRVLDELHPNTLMSRNNLAYWLAQRGDFDDAIDEFSSVLGDLEAVYGPDSPKSQQARRSLEETLERAGYLEAAMDITADQAASLERSCGPDHELVLWERWRLGNLLTEVGAVDEAISVYESLLIDQTRILGPDHEDTMTIRDTVDELRRALDA